MLEKSRRPIVPSRMPVEVTAPVARSAVAMVPSRSSAVVMPPVATSSVYGLRAVPEPERTRVASVALTTSFPTIPSTSAGRAEHEKAVPFQVSLCPTVHVGELIARVYPPDFVPLLINQLPAVNSKTSLPIKPSTSVKTAEAFCHTGIAQIHCDTSTSPVFPSLEFGERGHRSVRRPRLSMVIFVASCVPISTV